MDTPLQTLKSAIPQPIYTALEGLGFTSLRPAQTKAINQGLFGSKNMLICTPTASGKTLIAQMALLECIAHNKIGLYIVPLKALAQEKEAQCKKAFPELSIIKTVGDTDSDEAHLGKYQLIIATAEKFDSLLRHHSPWISQIGLVVVDEIHLLNDTSRGPTVEVLLTILLSLQLRIIGLSATIGNASQIAQWLSAVLVEDSWRPSALHHAVYTQGKLTVHKIQQ
jgi:helicase